MIPSLNGLDAWLAAREAEVPALPAGCEKRVTWAGTTERTPWSVVYIHGFSASRREVSPYPERLAQGLGANFFGTRLTGHGQDGAAMNRATLRDWRVDVAEALAIRRALGERALAGRLLLHRQHAPHARLGARGGGRGGGDAVAQLRPQG